MVRIVTDSTCDIPPEIAEKHNIHVVPMILTVDGTTYHDGQDITREKFYADFDSYKDMPKTAACSPEEMEACYRATGSTQVVSIHPSSKLSAVYRSAQIAALDMKEEGITVHVIDSKSVTIGLGLLVIEAAKLANQGKSAEEIVETVHQMRDKICIIALADTLKYLRKSGRVSAVSASIGELLQVKLVIELKEGVANPIERVRTRSRAMEKLLEEIKKRSVHPISKYAIVMTHGAEQAFDLSTLQRELTQIAPLDPDQLVLATPVIGSHVGPMGFAVAILSQ